MSTMTIEVRNRLRRTGESSVRRAELFQEVRNAARDIARHQDLDSLLRVVCRELLPALTSSRREEVESFEAPLRFVAGSLTRSRRTVDRSDVDRHYLLGRVESLLDLCAIATDQLVSASVMERVKKSGPSTSVLCLVATQGDVRRAVLAAEVGANSEQAFSNLLKWMEDAELIRRRSHGREKIVGLGPKGEVAFSMLLAERSFDHDALQGANQTPGQAAPIKWDVERSIDAQDDYLMDQNEALLARGIERETLCLPDACAPQASARESEQRVVEAFELPYAA